MAGTTRVTVTIRCYGGLAARFVFHVASSIVSPDDAVITGLIAVLEALTHGKAVHIEISLQAAVAGSPVSSATYVNEDKAFARFKDTSGVPHNYRVFGPKTTVFDSTDHETMVTGSPVAAFITAMTTYAVGRGGNTITSFVKGYRKENRKLIKGGSTT
jgi:hypothetical protein